MPTKSKSTLKVLLREPKQEKPVLVWQLIGYNGAGWSAAQVAWSGAVAVQVSVSPKFMYCLTLRRFPFWPIMFNNILFCYHFFSCFILGCFWGRRFSSWPGERGNRWRHCNDRVLCFGTLFCKARWHFLHFFKSFCYCVMIYTFRPIEFIFLIYHIPPWH